MYSQRAAVAGQLSGLKTHPNLYFMKGFQEFSSHPFSDIFAVHS